MTEPTGYDPGRLLNSASQELNMKDALSRRMVVTRGVLGTAAFVTAFGQLRKAQAAKFPQTSPAVAYQPSPKDGHQCDSCLLFQAPESCQVVDGKVAPTGWCKLWAKKAA
jgi:High potential iron-sulfur protein